MSTFSTANALTLGGTLSTQAQPNITSVGTLSQLEVSGLSTFSTANAITLGGTLSTQAQPNITSVGTLSQLQVSGVSTFSTVNAITLGGTLSTQAQPNITSIGILSQLQVSGVSTFSTATAITLGGTLSTQAQPNITSVGTLSQLQVSGVSTFSTATAITLGGTLSTQAQPNITSVGTLSSLAVNGVSTLSSLTATTVGIIGNLPSDSITSTGIYSGLISSGSYRLKFVNPTTTSSDAPSIDFSTTSTSFRGRIEYRHDQNSFRWYTNGQARCWMDGFGQMALGGTTAPAHTLDLITGNLSLRTGKIIMNGVDTLTTTTLGSTVVNSSLTSVGTLSSLRVSGDISGTNLNISGMATFNNIRSNGTATFANIIAGSIATFPTIFSSTINVDSDVSCNNVYSSGQFFGNNATYQGFLDVGGVISCQDSINVSNNISVNDQTINNDLIIYNNTICLGPFYPPSYNSFDINNNLSPTNGMIIFNTSTNKHQGYSNGTWHDFY